MLYIPHWSYVKVWWHLTDWLLDQYTFAKRTGRTQEAKALSVVYEGAVNQLDAAYTDGSRASDTVSLEGES